MALHLVGETLDKARGHYRAGTGKLVQLYRGIYVDAGDDIGATVLKHAVRIAKYLYPKAYLSAASAVTLAPTRDGRLFLSGRRKQRTRIRALEIIQNASAQASVRRLGRRRRWPGRIPGRRVVAPPALSRSLPSAQ